MRKVYSLNVTINPRFSDFKSDFTYYATNLKSLDKFVKKLENEFCTCDWYDGQDYSITLDRFRKLTDEESSQLKKYKKIFGVYVAKINDYVFIG